MDTIFRTFEASIDQVLDGERAVVARINTSGIDRLKTIIDPLGCDVSHFNKTRSVLWNHGLDPIRGTVPIGAGWAKVRRAERDMLGKTTFAKDDFSSQLFESYRDGTLRGWSIKAGVHESSPPTREEIRSRPELEECETIYRKWDLIEFSATPTPGNSDCLTMLVSRGLITAPEGFVPNARTINEVPLTKVDLGPMVMLDPPQKIVKRYITGSGDSWTVHAEDGKELGKHKTKEGAEKQLAAIEAHKHDEDRAMPWIDTDGKLWTVYHASGERAMVLPDPEMADECLQLLTAKPESKRSYYASEAAQALAETRRMFGDVRTEVQEYIDLYRHGKV